MQILIHVLVSAVLLFMVGKLVDGIEIRDAKAAIFGAACCAPNAKPIKSD